LYDDLFVLLSCEHPTLPLAEFESCLRGSGAKYYLKPSPFGTLRYYGPVDESISAIKRCALSRCLHLELSYGNSLEELLDNLQVKGISPAENEGFKVNVTSIKAPYNVTKPLSHVIRVLERELNLKLDWKSSRNVFHLIFSENSLLLGYELSPSARSEVLKRGPKYRPFKRPSTLPSTLARCMVNLSLLKENETLLDPFCGVGGILLESCSLGTNSIGGDLDYSLLKLAKNNLCFFGLNAELYHGDARFIPFHNLHGIVSDPPYGRLSSTHGIKLMDIYKGFIYSASLSLRENGMCVFLSPSMLGVEEICEKLGFLNEGLYTIYVHSALTRVIHVCRRV